MTYTSTKMKNCFIFHTSGRIRVASPNVLNMCHLTEREHLRCQQKRTRRCIYGIRMPFRAKNSDELKAVLAPDFVGHDLPPGLPPGPEGLILFRKKVNRSFPDQRVVVEDLIAVGDRIVARLTMTQTHQGEFMGIPATEEPVTIELIEIDRIENGRIAERWAKLDWLHVLRQLGATQIPQS